MADQIIAIQRGKKVGWLTGHGPPSNAAPFTGSDIDAELFEPIRPGPTADSTFYTADNATWPTADGGILEGATDVLDASVIAAGAAIMVEAASAADVLDATVIAVSVPGGGYYPPPRPFPVEGIGYGILPELEGEARGVVIVVGVGVGALPGLVGAAAGTVGVAGRSAARLVVGAAAIGDRGQAGAAAAVLKGLSIASAGVVGTHGAGAGIVELKGAAVGQHDDDEAIVAWLLAA